MIDSIEPTAASTRAGSIGGAPSASGAASALSRSCEIRARISPFGRMRQFWAGRPHRRESRLPGAPLAPCVSFAASADPRLPSPAAVRLSRRASEPDLQGSRTLHPPCRSPFKCGARFWQVRRASAFGQCWWRRNLESFISLQLCERALGTGLGGELLRGGLDHLTV